MKPKEPLALFHSWALEQRPRHFDLGQLQDWAPPAIIGLADERQLARYGVGRWECQLSDNRLSWSDGVYDIFGLPRGANVSRPQAVNLYDEDSRAVMERLRAYAIRHRRGFTLDARICPGSAPPRWMRLIAAPVCDGDSVVSLQGLKLLI